jgi:DNA-binding LacI/PurR family transcriptional regulator
LPEAFFDEFLTADFINKHAAGVHLEFYKMPVSDSLFDMGQNIGEQLLGFIKKAHGPSAVYINDDLISATVMRCFKEKGFSVPEDLAILSWDGLPESDYFITPLTTCVIPHAKMIQAARDWIEDKPFKSKQIIFDIEIREGKTLPDRK